MVTAAPDGGHWTQRRGRLFALRVSATGLRGEATMDAATLYTVIAVASGPKRMTTEQFPTMTICEKAAKKLRKQAPLSTATFYCVKRKVDAPKRVAVPKKKPTPAVAQPAAAMPVGMPREFYTGTTAKQ